MSEPEAGGFEFEFAYDKSQVAAVGGIPKQLLEELRARGPEIYEALEQAPHGHVIVLFAADGRRDFGVVPVGRLRRLADVAPSAREEVDHILAKPATPKQLWLLAVIDVGFGRMLVERESFLIPGPYVRGGEA